jgi:hypothetical protein
MCRESCVDVPGSIGRHAFNSTTFEAARHEQRTPHLNPSGFRQTAQKRANSSPLGQRHVIEI